MVFTKMRTTSLKSSRSRDQCSSSRMELNMRESGTHQLTRDMDVAIKFGLMGPFMKDTGKTIKLMVEVDLFMPMVISMMATGRTIRLMGSDNTLTPMELNTKVTGWTISNTAKAKNTGQMVLNTRETINLERKMVLVSSCGPINLLTAVIS